MSEVGSALAAAHDVGILHRDLKPSNIFLARRPGMPERAVLLDFGLAKLMEGEHAKLTATGATMGTPMYMSPEQAQGLVVDRRTDVYALGAVAFECLTARPPFDGPNVTAILAKVLTQPPPRLRDYDPSLPKGLEDVLVRTLSKDANERPPSVPALLAAMHAAAGDTPSDRTPPAGSRPVPPTQATPMVVEVKRATPNRMRWWVGGVVGLALVGAGVAVGLSWRETSPRGVAPVVAPVPVEHHGAAPSPAEVDAGVEAPAEPVPPAPDEETKAAPAARPRPRARATPPSVDLGGLGAAGVRMQLPRAREALQREAAGIALDRPTACAYPREDASLRILPGGAPLADTLRESHDALCATTPATERARAAHREVIARATRHLDRLEAAARAQ